MSSSNLHLDPVKARKLAGKLAKLAEKRKAQHTQREAERYEMERDNSEIGLAVDSLKELVIQRRNELKKIKDDKSFLSTIEDESDSESQEESGESDSIESNDKNTGNNKEGDEEREDSVHSKDTTVSQIMFDEKRQQLLQNEDRVLEAQIEHYRYYAERDVDPPGNLVEQEVKIKNLLHHIVDEQKKDLPGYKQYRHEVFDEHKEIHDLLEESRIMLNGLKERRDEIATRAGLISPERLIEETREKEDQLEDEVNRLMNQVQDIFNGVYDADEDDEEAGEEDIRHYFKPVRGDVELEQRRRLEFSSLLSELMNKGFETPADPYVPGLEYSRQMALLLLRVGIAVEHPNDARRLRLVDFHKNFDNADEFQP